MTATAFNAFTIIKRYEEAEIPKQHIDAHVEVLMEVTDNLATKEDINSLHKDIEHLSESFDLKLAALQSGLTNTLTLRFIGIVGSAIVAMKYLP